MLLYIIKHAGYSNTNIYNMEYKNSKKNKQTNNKEQKNWDTVL